MSPWTRPTPGSGAGPVGGGADWRRRPGGPQCRPLTRALVRRQGDSMSTPERGASAITLDRDRQGHHPRAPGGRAHAVRQAGSRGRAVTGRGAPARPAPDRELGHAGGGRDRSPAGGFRPPGHDRPAGRGRPAGHRREADAVPEVAYVVITSGGFDLLAEVVCEGTEDCSRCSTTSSGRCPASPRPTPSPTCTSRSRPTAGAPADRSPPAGPRAHGRDLASRRGRLVVVLAGCSSSGGEAATTTTRPPNADRPDGHRGRLLQRVAPAHRPGTGHRRRPYLQRGRQHRGAAGHRQELATHAPASIAGPTARYTVVIAAVADALAQQSPTSATTPAHQLSPGQHGRAGPIPATHCPKA